MKYLFTLLLTISCSAIAFAQSARHFSFSTKKSIAVYVAGKGINPSICDEVRDRLSAAIYEQGQYIVTERSGESLKLIQSEQIYQHSGNVDDNQITKMGKQDGASVVCVAHIRQVGEDYRLTVKLLDVERASLLKRPEQASLQGLRNTNKLLRTVDEMAENLLEIKLRRAYQGFQVAAEGMVFPKARQAGGNLVAGYRFNDFLFLGAGSGYYGYSGEDYTGMIIPLFADLRVNVLPYKLSPYFAVAGGLCFDRYANTDTYVDPTGATQKESRHQDIYGYFQASAGLHLRCSRTVAVFAGGGYSNIAEAAVIQAGLSITF
jgi:hypothetical protein